MPAHSQAAENYKSVENGTHVSSEHDVSTTRQHNLTSAIPTSLIVLKKGRKFKKKKKEKKGNSIRDYTTAKLLVHIVESLSFKNQSLNRFKKSFLQTIGRDKTFGYVGLKLGPPKTPA